MTLNSPLSFEAHTLETAPADSRPALKKLNDAVGMIPNLAATMSESPVLIEAFESLRSMILAKGALNRQESEIVSLTFAVENGCRYCAAIHSTFALAAGLDRASIDAIRSRGLPAEPRLARLTSLARALVSSRGHVTEAELDSFIRGGFSKAHALELVARLAMSVTANYSAHITRPTPDEAIRPEYR